MPEATDLMGLGMESHMANILGNDDSIVTCAGTTQAAATLIKTTNVEFSASGGATGAILSATLPIGSPVYGITTSSTAAIIYCPVGHSMNTSLNGSLSLAQNKAAVLIQYKKGFWSSVLTA